MWWVNFVQIEIFYTIINFSKLRYHKWTHILHLNLRAKNHGQKKGWESNQQFESQTQKPKK